MAYTPQNFGESDGNFELLDDKALKAMFNHLKHEMGIARKRHDRLRYQAKVVAEEIKRREGREEKVNDQVLDGR